MSQKQPKPFPFDIRELAKGTYISPQELQSVVRDRNGNLLEIGSDPYKLEVLQIKSWIENESVSNGEPLVVKGEKDGLRILTDAEATEYLAQLQRCNLRSFIKNNTRHNQRIDPTQLDEKQLKQYNSNVTSFGFLRGALEKAAKKISLPVFKSDVPKVLVEKKS